MLQVLLATACLAVASFAAAGVLVLVVGRALRVLDGAPRADAPDIPDGPHAGSGRQPRRFERRRFGRRREPAWWPDFEREFADYVRTGAGRES